jgi:hypothetical protein
MTNSKTVIKILEGIILYPLLLLGCLLLGFLASISIAVTGTTKVFFIHLKEEFKNGSAKH